MSIKHARRVRAALLVHVRVEDDRDDEPDDRDEQDERSRRARPVGRHAVARQVARHEVQQAGHRGRAGEPQDRDRDQVVDAAEQLAEIAVREEGERAPVGGAARGERVGRNQRRRHDRAADEQHAHRSAPPCAAACGCWRSAIAAASASSSPCPATSGITATPVSNPDRPSASLGKQQRRDRDHHQRIRLLREHVRLPVGDRRRMLPQPHQLVADDDRRSARDRRRRGRPRARSPRESL